MADNLTQMQLLYLTHKKVADNINALIVAVEELDGGTDPILEPIQLLYLTHEKVADRINGLITKVEALDGGALPVLEPIQLLYLTHEKVADRINGLITKVEALDVGSLYLALQSGQSLSIGVTDAGNLPIDTDPLTGAYLFTGVPPTSKLDTPIIPADIATIETYEATATRQTHGYSMLRGLINDVGGQWLYASHGKGSSSVTDLGVGSVMYDNGIDMLGALTVRADELELTPIVPFLDFIQGETGFTTRANDHAELRALQDAYTSEVNAVTGQAVLPIILDQTGINYGVDSALSRFAYTLDNTDAYMACPKYMLNRLYNSDAGDYTHLNAEGYIIQGEYHSICANAVTKGEDYKSLQPISYAVVGNTIEITTNKTLVLDAVTLPQCPSEGFNYDSVFDGDIVPTVSLSGNKVILDIGQPPLWRDTIQFGYSLDDSATHPSGVKLPCGNIRSNDGVASAVAGWVLHHWLVQFDYEVQKSDGTTTNIWRFDDPLTGIVAAAAGTFIAGSGNDTNPEFEIDQTWQINLKHNGTGSFRYRVADKSTVLTGTGVEKQESYTITVGATNLRNEMQHWSSGFTGDIYDIDVQLI